MEKIKKFLLKLSSEERTRIENVLTKLIAGDLNDLDIKKLKGYAHIFRVRVGKNRIIFRKEGNDIRVLEISRRNEGTYK